MGKYLHKYESENDFQDAYNGEEYLEPWVSYTTDQEVDEHVDYNKQPVQIPIRLYGDGEQLLLTKKTNGSVLTLTREDVITMVGNASNPFTLDATNSFMATFIQNYATFNPSDAYNDSGLGAGVNANDAPITVDFGEEWLAYVLSYAEMPTALTELSVYIFDV